MAEETRVLSVDDFEHRLMVNSLNELRNDLIRQHKPHEDVDELLLKIIDAPPQSRKRRAARDER